MLPTTLATCPLLQELDRYVQATKPQDLVFRTRERDGVAWHTTTLTLEEHKMTKSGHTILADSFEIWYRPSGRVTLSEVEALRAMNRNAIMGRPTVVLVSPGGFEKSALASIRRSKWIDYFDLEHLPREWKVARGAGVGKS